MILINNQEDFEQTCSKIAKEDALFIDTEFYRRHTYYAKLSIIQIATRNEQIIIDTLKKIDLTSFKNILANASIIKVFHAPDQDFEIFFQLFKELPQNVFDTQIAAELCGFGESMGYMRLCKALLGVEIDKSLQKANWLKRPLAQELLEYAIKDVEFLIPLYDMLSKKLEENGLWDKYNEKAQKLIKPENYVPSIERLTKKIKVLEYSKKVKERLHYFVELREECAQYNNLPRAICASDFELREIARTLPTNETQLRRLNLHARPLGQKQFKEKLLDLCAGIKAGG